MSFFLLTNVVVFRGFEEKAIGPVFTNNKNKKKIISILIITIFNYNRIILEFFSQIFVPSQYY